MKKMKKKIGKKFWCPNCKKFVKDFNVSILGDTQGPKTGPLGKAGWPFKMCTKCGSELMELTRTKKKK
jgi:hypothetical protein